MIGTSVRHYQIEARIGGGGMGVVYRARDTRLDRQVALKFLPPSLSGDKSANERFVQEAKAASALNHESVCAIHDIGETDDGHLFIVMALYGGQTLRERLREGAFPEREALGIVRQIANGLRTAHDRGIIHRDIKPSNIILTEEGRAVILDFGLAKLTGGVDLTRTGRTLGTARYMSPEQARSEPVDERTDIWSLGVVMHELLSGTPPFSGEYDHAILYSILNADPLPLAINGSDRRTSDLQRVVSIALEKDREDRFASVADFISALDEIGSGRSGDAHERTGSARRSGVRSPKRQLRGRVVRQVLPAALVVVVALVATIALFSSGRFLSRSDQRIRSVAVLPLIDYSGDTGQDFLADGMTDALINELAQIGSIRVISRQSVMRFKGSDRSLRDIADELGVDGIISGSVVRNGDSIRVAANLVSDREENIWSDSFVARFENVLRLHADLTQEIARQINATLEPDDDARLASARQVDPAAYELYLRGHYHLYKLSRSDAETALTYFEESLAIDSTYAEAHAGVAVSWLVLRQMGALAPSEVEDAMSSALSRAAELDSTLAVVHFTRATHATWSLWNWSEGEANFKKALAANPNYAEAHAYYAHLLFITGRFEEGLAHAEKAVALDPFNALLTSLYADNLMFAGRYDDSARQFLKSQETAPNSFVTFNGLNWIYREQGHLQEANDQRIAKYEAARDTAMVAALKDGFADGGYREASLRAAALLVARSDTSFVSPILIERLYVDAGEHEPAIDWIKRAIDLKDPGVPYIGLGPDVAILSRSNRYPALLEQVNLEAHWTEPP